jgi:hypothetical protein
MRKNPWKDGKVQVGKNHIIFVHDLYFTLFLALISIAIKMSQNSGSKVFLLS